MFEYLERYHKRTLNLTVFIQNDISEHHPSLSTNKKHQNPSQVPHRPQPANKWRAPVTWESHVPSTLDDSLLHSTLLLQHPKTKMILLFLHLQKCSFCRRPPIRELNRTQGPSHEISTLKNGTSHLCGLYIALLPSCIYQPTWPTFWDQQAICCFPTLHAARRRSPRLPRA